MTRFRLTALFSLIALQVMWTASAAAALRPEQRGCQAGVARAADRFVDRTAAALAICRERVSKGDLPAATDCNTESGTVARLAAHSATLGTTIGKRCTDVTVSSLVFGGDCLGAATAADLTLCIRTTHETEVDHLIDVLYGTGDLLTAPARKCQKTASTEGRKFARKRLRFSRKCKNDAARGKLAAGTVCAEDSTTLERISKERAKRIAKIEARCDAAALANLEFGGECAAPADGAALAECILSVGTDGTDAYLLAQYGDVSGFCGDSFQSVDAAIDALLAEMTLGEKVQQMHGSPNISGIPGLWYTADNDRLGIPGFRMVDGARGVSAATGNATAFPVGMARGATWDPDLEQRIGEAIGTEARAKGASVLLAPVTTVVRHPRWGRVQETYGEDPLHVGRMGVGFIHGAQQHVIASVKHFAVNSIEDTRFDVNVSIDERALREIYLPHFKMAVEEGRVGSVMSAYNQVNGSYCAENFHLLRDILKGEWGFDGFVESDWIFGTKSTVPSALNGLDIEMPLPQFYGSNLVAAVQAGDVPEATIDEAVRRILRTKYCFRLDDDPPVPNPALIESQTHTDLALEAARKAIVLLQNTGATLPLDRGTLQSIAIVGPIADHGNLGDTGSSDVSPSYAVTARVGIEDRAGTIPVTYIPAGACAPDVEDRIACTAVPLSAPEEAAVAAADVAIVVVGYTAANEGEGFVGAGDRQTMLLPADQEQLVSDVAALNDATVVVLEGGGAVVVESWINDVEALLMAWYPGLEGGNAIADILFGDTNPSAKLPVTFPVADSDLPPFDNQSLEVTYDYYHGYRLLDRNGVDPRFPFGFGLSYTTYAYSNLSLSDSNLAADGTLLVDVDVTNTGTVAGDEIVQLYVSYQGSSVDRPELDLKGFAKVSLAPSETKTVTFELRAEDLAFYDEVSGWVVEPIPYRAHVGSSSRDLPLDASFAIP